MVTWFGTRGFGRIITHDTVTAVTHFRIGSGIGRQEKICFHWYKNFLANPTEFTHIWIELGDKEIYAIMPRGPKNRLPQKRSLPNPNYRLRLQSTPDSTVCPPHANAIDSSRLIVVRSYYFRTNIGALNCTNFITKNGKCNWLFQRNAQKPI